jgi:hypothetical protein
MLRRTLCALALATCASACGSLPTWYVEEPAPAPETVVAYEPTYYGDNVVYYDDGGRPYYYDGVAVVWIQPAWPGYWGYVDHYRRFGPAYHAWYHSHPVYGGYHGGYHGGYRGGFHGSGGGHRR